MAREGCLCEITIAVHEQLQDITLQMIQAIVVENYG